MKSFFSTIFLTMICFGASADEGMWTLNNFPSKKVQKQYRFNATKEWLDHVRLSSARLAGGCSGSFVSKNGLILTNHHCAHTCIEQLSTAKTDYVEKGFSAKNQTDEVKCPEIEINRLVEITDVTPQITGATKGLKGKEFGDAQKATKAKIEKDCAQGNELVRCDVVTLYHGGQYQLYKYQRYQDVRLVFAPEFAIAFFGGDPDNFNFPRYTYDMSILRVYDQGKPLETKNYFQWSKDGVKDGDMTFVTGHPGRTSRLLTIAELEYQRDISLPRALLRLAEERGLLTEFQNRGEEQKRISNGRLFSVENSLKAIRGKFQALTDKEFFAQKIKAENELRKKINANPNWKKEFASAWDDMAKAQIDLKKNAKEIVYMEDNHFGSQIYRIAKNLVRAASELPKENGLRLREFSDSKLPGLKQSLFSKAPIYNEFEITVLTFHLTKLREELTTNHPFVKKVLGQKSPEELARELITGSKLKDPKVREELFNGGIKAIEASKDPMIRFALAIDSDTRAVRKNFDDNIEPVLDAASEKIAKAQFAAYGTETYPDATFTLRISYGQVKGYQEDNHFVQPITTLDGLYDHATGRVPFELPASWLKAKTKIPSTTPVNFASTNDIIGGNSGSPVINKNAEIVGLIFDGNIQSLSGDYGYDIRTNRAIAVHSSLLLEALKKVYGADRLVDDLLK